MGEGDWVGWHRGPLQLGLPPVCLQQGTDQVTGYPVLTQRQLMGFFSSAEEAGVLEMFLVASLRGQEV